MHVTNTNYRWFSPNFKAAAAKNEKVLRERQHNVQEPQRLLARVSHDDGRRCHFYPQPPMDFKHSHAFEPCMRDFQSAVDRKQQQKCEHRRCPDTDL